MKEEPCEVVNILHCLQSKCRRSVVGSKHSSTARSQWLTKSTIAAWHCTSVKPHVHKCVSACIRKAFGTCSTWQVTHIFHAHLTVFSLGFIIHHNLIGATDKPQLFLMPPKVCELRHFLEYNQGLSYKQTQFAIAYDCHLVRLLNDLQNGSAELTCLVLPKINPPM